MRSFRASIAGRVAVAVGILLSATAIVSLYVLGRLLENDLDATLLRIAEVEAGAGASATGTSFQFHEAILLTKADPAIPELSRYAQLLTGDGAVLLRSQTLARDLPIPMDALASARAGSVAWSTHAGPGGARFRSLLYPLFLLGADHGDHVLQVAAPYAPLAETVRRFGWMLGILTLGATGIAFVMGWRASDLALRPTREIAAQAGAVELGAVDARITAHQDVAEFRELVRVLNAMLDRLQQSFESQRRFVADASHELRSPLNVLRGEIEVALKRPRTDTEYREVLARCREEVLRLGGLVNDLLTLARADAGALQPRLEPVDLYEIATAVADRYRPLAGDREIALTVNGDHRWVQADAALLERAVSNLVDNALKHTGSGGRVEVLVEPGNPSSVVVRDSGAGVAGEDRDKLFERFFQADPARPRDQGTGLGLAIARAAAEAHGGTLQYEGNDPGAVFRVLIPAPVIPAPDAVVGAGAGD